MMFLQFVPSAWPLFLVAITVVECQRMLDVFYAHTSICALKDSSVTMAVRIPTRFPFFHRSVQVSWRKDESPGDRWIYTPLDLTEVVEYSARVQYFQTGEQDWNMKLSNVKEEDQSNYYAVIQTEGGRWWRGRDEVSLAVTELRVEMNTDIVFEGHEAILTCKTTCILSETPIFTWYKQDLFISVSEQLHLPSVRPEDAGSYSCAVNGQTHRSPDVTLKVNYPPRSASVSVSPSGEIVEGSSVTLTCSSDANPPVSSFTWYRGGSFLRIGRTFSITKISSKNSGLYMCKSSNLYGEKLSSEVTLVVLNPPKNVSVSVSPSAERVEGSLVTLTCSCDAKPPVRSYTWFKVNESSPVGYGQSYSFYLSPGSNDRFYCVAQNKFGFRKAAPVAVTPRASASSGHSSSFIVVCVAVCVGVAAIAAFIAGFFCVRRRRQKRTAVNHQQDGAPCAEDNTYASLDPMSRSSNDVYSTLATVRPRPPDDPYTTLDPCTISADYHMSTTMRKYR